MNNKRIRYNETKPGILQSRRFYMTKAGQEVMVELDLTAKKYRVLDSVTGVEVTSGGGTINVSVLKIFAKRSLMKLGVEFADEKRTREVLT